MGRVAAIARLRTFEPKLRALGIDAAFLFGSTSRGDDRPESDIDILIDLRKDASFTLLDLAAARRLLSEGLSTDVDITTLTDLSTPAGEHIIAEAIRIF